MYHLPHSHAFVHGYVELDQLSVSHEDVRRAQHDGMQQFCDRIRENQDRCAESPGSQWAPKSPYVRY